MDTSRDNKGFTLIELLIVVAIIGILAAIMVPAYLGMQERGRKGAVQRAAGAAEAELQAWVQSARLGSPLTEVDSNGNGRVEDTDVNDLTLTQDLTVQDQICSRYVLARWNLNSERSPWVAGASLWVSGLPQTGVISCSHPNNARAVTLIARDAYDHEFYRKVISAD